MAAFYSNLVQHLYVVTQNYSGTTPVAEGEVYVGAAANRKKIYVLHFGKGGLTTSDLIDVDNIKYIDYTDSAKLGSKLLKTSVKLPSNADLIVGEDYILRITVIPFISLSELNSYIKDAAVHVTSTINTLAKFALAMINSLIKNFKRDIAVKDLFGFNYNSTAGTLDIYGQPQTDWKLGKVPVSDVHFNVGVCEVTNPTTGVTELWSDLITTSYVNVGSKYYTMDEYNDGVSKTSSGITLTSNSGKKIADLEKWSLTERADIYGNMGYPYDMPSEGMVNPSSNYSVLNIHYAFKDGGTAYYESEKDLTFVATDSKKAALTAIKDAILNYAPNALFRNNGGAEEYIDVTDTLENGDSVVGLYTYDSGTDTYSEATGTYNSSGTTKYYQKVIY